MRGLLIALLALAPLAAGCGSDPSAFEGSGDALKDASSSRVEWKVDGLKLPAWASMRLTGEMDYAADRGELLINANNDSDPAEQIRLVGHDVYIGARAGGSMHWMKQTSEDPIGARRFLPGPGGARPDRLLNTLRDSSTNVDKLGTDEIRGVTATHYRAHLDKAKIGAGSGIKTDEPGTVDVWIDEQGLPRRIRVPDNGAGETAQVVDLFDFGVPVDVKAPADDEIVSEHEFELLMEKECASAGKDLEKMSPLCLIFTATISEGSSGAMQRSPDRTLKPIEGK